MNSPYGNDDENYVFCINCGAVPERIPSFKDRCWCGGEVIDCPDPYEANNGRREEYQQMWNEELRSKS